MISPKQFVHSNQTMASGIDKGLIKMFLKMTPEERILSNDNAVKAIMELRNAFKQHQLSNSRSEPSA